MDDDNGNDSGSAYVYDLDGNLITKLTAFDGAAGNYFGYSVSVGSGRIVVGAYRDGYSGTIFTYDLNGNLVYKLAVNSLTAEDYFGWSVAVGSGRIVVGSIENFPDGAAYVYNIDSRSGTKLLGDS
jgi:Tol biopolymer transport system component